MSAALAPALPAPVCTAPGIHVVRTPSGRHYAVTDAGPTRYSALSVRACMDGYKAQPWAEAHTIPRAGCVSVSSDPNPTEVVIEPPHLTAARYEDAGFGDFAKDLGIPVGDPIPRQTFAMMVEAYQVQHTDRRRAMALVAEAQALLDGLVESTT